MLGCCAKNLSSLRTWGLGLALKQVRKDGSKEEGSFKKMTKHEERKRGRECYLGSVRLGVKGRCGEVTLNGYMWAHIIKGLANKAEMQKLDPEGSCEFILCP